MKTKTSETTPIQLNWLVAKCEGFTPLYKNIPHANLRSKLGNIWHLDELNYSTDWAQGGLLIEREFISVLQPGYDHWIAEIYGQFEQAGPTPLIAAMRCYVASKLGDEVEIPDGLIKE